MAAVEGGLDGARVQAGVFSLMSEKDGFDKVAYLLKSAQVDHRRFYMVFMISCSANTLSLLLSTTVQYL